MHGSQTSYMFQRRHIVDVTRKDTAMGFAARCFKPPNPSTGGTSFPKGQGAANQAFGVVTAAARHCPAECIHLGSAFNAPGSCIWMPRPAGARHADVRKWNSNLGQTLRQASGFDTFVDDLAGKVAEPLAYHGTCKCTMHLRLPVCHAEAQLAWIQKLVLLGKQDFIVVVPLVANRRFGCGKGVAKRAQHWL